MITLQQKFLLACIEGDDGILFTKAIMTINMCAYSGMPASRENDFLEMLRAENKNKEIFKPAIKQVNKYSVKFRIFKTIFGTFFF